MGKKPFGKGNAYQTRPADGPRQHALPTHARGNANASRWVTLLGDRPMTIPLWCCLITGG
jgi:hypothetical protein